MSRELYEALMNWIEASASCDQLGRQDGETPTDRKKPDDTEGGDCD